MKNGFDIIPIRGGFGNQLFCWARGVQLEEEGRQVFYDKGSHLGRGFELAHLQRARRVALPPQVWRWIARREATFSNALVELHYENQSNDPVIIPKRSPVTFHWGYWQSSDYFADVKDVIGARLSTSLAIRPEKKSSVCRIHVRRGDYVTDAGAARTLGALPLDYYREAIDRMKTVGFDRFVVHTDDRQWVSDNLVGKDVELSLPGTAREDFCSIASARGIIMSNSSFSWWASFIASRSEAVNVIGPVRWFADESLSSKRLMEESWVRL